VGVTKLPPPHRDTPPSHGTPPPPTPTRPHDWDGAARARELRGVPALTRGTSRTTASSRKGREWALNAVEGRYGVKKGATLPFCY